MNLGTGSRANIDYLTNVVDWIPEDDVTFRDSVVDLCKVTKSEIRVRHEKGTVPPIREAVRELLGRLDRESIKCGRIELPGDLVGD